MDSAGRRFDALESWRGIAACLVALYHLRGAAHSHLAGVELLRNGYLWVDFFFVLSGFVIAANYHERLHAGFGVWRFALLRFGRLYPLHAATLGICILLHLGPALSGLGAEAPFQPPQRSVDTVIANLLLVHSLHVLDFPTWNWPSWSISTEFYTYLLYALALAALKERIWLALVAAVLVCAAALWLLVPHLDEATYDYGILRCVLGFSAGVLTWRLHCAARLRPGTAHELLCIALVVAFIWGAGGSALSIAAPAVFAAVVLVFAAEGGAASRLLRQRVFLVLGAHSYSIYMVHFIVALAVIDAAKLLRMAGIDLFSGARLGREPWQGDVAYSLYFALVLGVSALTYRWIEVPARAWFRRIAGARAARRIALPSL